MSLFRVCGGIEPAARPVVSPSAADREPAPVMVQPAPDDAHTALYVATDLDCWTTDEPHYYAHDVVDAGRCYRRLDPVYYAWLYHRMLDAGLAMKASKLNADVYARLCDRFNVIHQWAMGRSNRQAFIAAVSDFRSGGYEPPPLHASWES